MLLREWIRQVVQRGGRLDNLFTVLLAQLLYLLDQVLEILEVVLLIALI